MSVKREIEDLRLKSKLIEIKNSKYNLLEELIWNKKKMSLMDLRMKLDDVYQEMATQTWKEIEVYDNKITREEEEKKENV